MFRTIEEVNRKAAPAAVEAELVVDSEGAGVVGGTGVVLELMNALSLINCLNHLAESLAILFLSGSLKST